MIFKEAVKIQLSFSWSLFSVGAVISQPFLSVRKQNSMIEKKGKNVRDINRWIR